MIERRSAIAALLTQASKTQQLAQAAVTITERRPLTILQVSAFGSTQPEAAAALAAVLNIDLPSPNQMTSNAVFSVRLLGPGIWQIVGDSKATPPITPLIPVGKSTWWQGVKSGKFPKPIKLGERTTAWRVSDIQKLIESEVFQLCG